MKSKDSRICIIGAGAAGLSAAYFLKERGYRRVTVLERGDRVGGKCRTIDYRGRSFDLGANYVTAAYVEVRKLARKYRAALYTEAAATIGHALPSGKIAFSTPLSAIIRNHSALDVAIAAMRYVWTRLRLRKVVDQPGFAAIGDHPELCTSFGAWMRANRLTALDILFEAPVTVMGYGYLDEIPAPYALKYLRLPTYFNLIAVALGLPRRWPKRFVNGFERLWHAIASELDVRRNANISGVDRNGCIRVSLEGSHTWEFDYLVLACPLQAQLLGRFLSLSTEEHDLFRRIISNRYVVVTYAIENMQLPKPVIGMSPIPAPGEPWAVTRQFADNELVQFYTRLDDQRPMSEAQVLERIRRFVTGLGAILPEKYITYDEWNYFPHVSALDLRDGFYDRLEALQGQLGTFYCGGVAAFESVETVVEYSRRLIEVHF